MKSEPQAHADDMEEIDGIDAVSALSEPTRRRLYDAVAASPDPIDRDDAAVAVGISRELAAFHLDRLVAAKLLEPVFRRRSGRKGPGAGRPAKFYRRAASTIRVSFPPRDYELAASLFAAALEETPRGAARRRLLDVARGHGEALAARQPRPSGDSRAVLVESLRSIGFEPDLSADSIRLRNCPFDALAESHRAVTCPMNLAMLSGLASGLDTDLVPYPLPGNERCCVEFRAGSLERE